jgi:uncharacterized repeat protein (TIGR01451 family)
LKTLRLFMLCGAAAICQHAAELPVALGSAGTFTALAGSTVTNTGPTIVNGDVGVSAGSAVTGFPPGTVVGGAIHAADGPAALAQLDLTTAYNNAAGRNVAPVTVAGDLGGLTLAPGLYKSTSTLGITGVLRLDGGGNPNAVWIFQVASALTTASGSQIILQGGAQAANIFWQVGSSATLGTTSIFNGTIMAQASVSIATGAALNGRALARTGAVSLDSNTAINPGPPTVGAPPAALSVACPLANAVAGSPYNSLIAATGGTPPYGFSTTGALPGGLVLNPATGSITGTPTGASATFLANATDAASGSASRSCTITVAAAPPPPPAALSVACPLANAAAGSPYNSAITATGGTPPYGFSTTGALPGGLVLNSATGSITGTPTGATATFLANATDAASGSASRSCTITLAAASADLSITKTGPATAGSNTDITYTISVSNAGPNSASSVVVSDVLPAGLTFVSATPSQGSCSGTTTVTCSLGTMNLSASATISLVAHTPINFSSFSNTATVSSATADPTPANNTSTASTAPAATIPTLSTLGIGLLTLLLAGFGVVALRRMRPVQY